VTMTKNTLNALLLLLAVWIPVAAQENTGPPDTPTYGKATAENWWYRFWNQVELHRKRVNVWPEPFAHHDRELVRGPFRQMADNGWKSQNTFTDYLFDPSSNELTAAGQAKLYHILTQVPPHRRQVYVLEAPTREETAARLAAVYRMVAQIAPETAPCAIMTTKVAPRGGEGWYVYEVDETYRTNFTGRLNGYLSSGGVTASQSGYSNASPGGDSSGGSGGTNGNGGTN
jgi:hypothetical protein